MSDDSQERCLNYAAMAAYLERTVSEQDRSTLYHLRSCARCGLAFDVLAYLIRHDGDAAERAFLAMIMRALPKNLKQMLPPTSRNVHKSSHSEGADA
jgi:hypothetical protein